MFVCVLTSCLAKRYWPHTSSFSDVFFLPVVCLLLALCMNIKSLLSFQTVGLCLLLSLQTSLCQVFGLPLEVTAVAEANPTAQRFIMQVWGPLVHHGYGSNDEISDGVGTCFLHKGASCDCSGPVDICAAGLPCLPFTILRQKSGHTQNAQEAETHGAYDTVMVKFFDYIRDRQPKSLWVEQVPGFANVSARLGKSHLQSFCERLQEAGYGTHCLQLCHSAFVQQRRPRLFILAVSSSAGGQCAADRSATLIKEVLSEVCRFPAADLFSVIDPSSSIEEAYRMQVPLASLRQLSAFLFLESVVRGKRLESRGESQPQPLLLLSWSLQVALSF